MLDDSVLYVGSPHCLERIPVPSRQKISARNADRALRGAHDVTIVEVCPSEWGGISQDYTETTRMLDILGQAEFHTVDCMEERSRLIAEAGKDV